MIIRLMLYNRSENTVALGNAKQPRNTPRLLGVVSRLCGGAADLVQTAGLRAVLAVARTSGVD